MDTDKNEVDNKEEEEEEEEEELFCICQQSEHGRMIACDSDKRIFEWFHFEYRHGGLVVKASAS